MSAEIVSKIFDPYFTTKETGSGLGLAICHSIVTKHGGAISVDSLPQAGTVFTLYLPLSQSTAVQEVEEEVMLKPKAACVMIMDDDEMIRRVAATMLEMEGHEVVLAKNGEEAITLYLERFASAKPVDLVIMDLTIPGGMGGKEAVSEILAVNPRAKVIVSSGYSNDPIMANPQHFGFVAALVKPIRLLPFQKIINQVLSQS
jgi:CheY-like chemotaxis protein